MPDNVEAWAMFVWIVILGEVHALELLSLGLAITLF